MPSDFEALFRGSLFLDIFGSLYCCETAVGLIIGLRVPKQAERAPFHPAVACS